MIRKLAVAVVVLAVTLVGGLLLASANLDSWLDENRDWLAGEVQRVVGREVSFGEIGVSIWSGFGVRVADISIGEDPAFSDGDFVSARENLAHCPTSPSAPTKVFRYDERDDPDELRAGLKRRVCTFSDLIPVERGIESNPVGVNLLPPRREVFSHLGAPGTAHPE